MAYAKAWHALFACTAFQLGMQSLKLNNEDYWSCHLLCCNVLPLVMGNSQTVAPCDVPNWTSVNIATSLWCNCRSWHLQIIIRQSWNWSIQVLNTKAHEIALLAFLPSHAILYASLQPWYHAQRWHCSMHGWSWWSRWSWWSVYWSLVSELDCIQKLITWITVMMAIMKGYTDTQLTPSIWMMSEFWHREYQKHAHRTIDVATIVINTQSERLNCLYHVHSMSAALSSPIIMQNLWMGAS